MCLIFLKKKTVINSLWRNVSDECFIGVKQLLKPSVCAIKLSCCEISTLLYACRKTLVFEMDATSLNPVYRPNGYIETSSDFANTLST
jgi:hypothetical protein